MMTRRLHVLSTLARLGMSLTLTVVLLTSTGQAAASTQVAPNIQNSQPVPATDAATDEARVPDGLTAGEWATMQEKMLEAQYQVTWQTHDGEWAYRAPNRAQGFSVAFAPDGLQATGYEVDGAVAWEFGLALTGYGAPTDLSAERTRVAYRWDDALTEWYENSAAGVEHGLTLAAPPAGTVGSEVELTFALRGSLTLDLDEAGQVLRLRDAAGSVVLLYDQLHVYDATNRSLPAYMRLVGCGDNLQPATCNLQLVIDSAGAAYPLTVDPLLHSEVAILRASDAANYDNFGTSVAISGDTVVVGTERINWGAAYVFERNQGGADSWGEVTKLTVSDAAYYGSFGHSVAISGDTVVVGAPDKDGPFSYRGAAYLFERNQGGADSWGQVEKLTASDAADDDHFGNSVAISGDTVVVGAPGITVAGTGRGAAYVFERNQGGADSWGQVKKLTASDAADDDLFGLSVAISGDTVVVAAWREDGAGTDRGAAYLFERNQGGADSWGEVTKLTASDAADDDWFGTVSISGDTLVVGALYEDGGAGDPLSNAGAAYVFERNQGGADNWGEVTILRASDAQAVDFFGSSVSISGDTLVVGAYFEDGGAGDPLSMAGAAYVFERNQGGADNWGEVTILRASDAQVGDGFGYAVSISGDTLVVGAYGEDGGAGDPKSSAGAAYIFNLAPAGAPEIDVQRPAGTSIADGGTDNVGNKAVGTVNLTYTIDNTAGTAQLSVTGVTPSNLTNCSNFVVGTALPLNVAAGSTATLDVSFDVDANGAFSLDMDIANNDADENPYDIAITGTGTGGVPEIDVQRPAGTSIADGGADNVGNKAVGTVNLTYTIDNTAGTAQLSVTGVTPSNLTNCSNFVVGTALPLNVAAGSTATLDVSFDVDANGAFSLDIDIANNDADENPYDIAITGAGTAGGTIVIEKVTDPAGGTGFQFTNNIPGGPTPFNLNDGQSQPFNNVAPGSYTVTETDPTVTPGGYTLTNLGCVETGTNDSFGTVGTRTATVNLEAGETVTCTFTNEADTDGDGVPDATDNCPNDANPNQEDSDHDGLGDVCDPTPYPIPVGGVIVPVNKLELVAPWMGLAALAGLAALGVVLVRRRRG